MKLSLLLRCLLTGMAALGSARAQDLPGGLMLPPLPELAPPSAERAHAPTRVRLAGLQGGPAPVFVPISHLTLPDKPSATLPPEPAPTVPELIPETAHEPALLPGDLPPGPGHPLLGPTDQPGAIDLLPPPGDLPSPDPEGQPLPDSAPDAPAPDSVPENEPDSLPEPGAVAGSDLLPTPQSDGKALNPNARGPLFRVRGADAFNLARQRGFRFSPAQGLGRRDGLHTVASQVPNVLTSEVHGTRMMQLRPSPLWTTPYIENTFYMFCDASYNAVRLSPGWKIRGIQLKGPDWQWVACPRSGANTASFSIRIRAWKSPTAPSQGTVVTLHGLTLEGPPGATDWKAAFPDLTRPAARPPKP